MKKTEEIKRLLDALETSNKLAAEQIERNRHSIELLWQMLKEGEQGAPFDEPLPPIEIRPDAMYKDTHLLISVPKDDKAPACLYGKAPHSDKIPNLSTQVMIGEPLDVEVKGEYKEIPVGVVGKDGEILPYIQPEEMKAGEWYVFGINTDETQIWLLKFNCILNDKLYFYKCIDLDFDGNNLGILTDNQMYFICNQIKNLRPATQAEILKYFPDEIECNTHGGNDAAYIKEFTDPQI